MSAEPRVLVASRNRIGESPVWDPLQQSLYWVDVEGASIHRWREADGDLREWEVGEPVGCIGLGKTVGLVGARRTGFFFLDVDTGAIEPVADPEQDMPDHRFNDGKVDRRGRFWAGTRNFVDTTKATGSLYRLDPDLSVHRMEQGLRCPNGMAWSPDDKRMYLCDTWVGNIYVYDFDADDGAIRNRRLFAKLNEGEGFPDGLTVDADGYVWNAHYDGWRISRYAPDGRLDRVVAMPVQNVTSVTFGGEHNAILFATSSHLRLSTEERIRQSLAGHVFVLSPGVCGIAEPRFGA